MKAAAVAVFIDAFRGMVPEFDEMAVFTVGFTSIKEPEAVFKEQLFTRKFHAAEPAFFTLRFMSKSMSRSNFFKSLSLTFLPCTRAVARFTACTAFMPLFRNEFLSVSKDGRLIFTSESESEGLKTGTSKLLLNGSVRLCLSSKGIALKSSDAAPSMENGSAVFPERLFARFRIASYGILNVRAFVFEPIAATLTPCDVAIFVNELPLHSTFAATSLMENAIGYGFVIE